MNWRFNPASQPQGRAQIHGYSLLEILIVLALLAIIASIAPLAYKSIIPSAETRSAATQVASLLRHAKSETIRVGHDVRVLIDVENDRAWCPDLDTNVSWPDSVTVVASIAGSEKQTDSVGAIRFFGDGGASGGKLRFISGQREYQVDVDWLTGIAEVSRRSPQSED